MKGALEGILVADFSHVFAGPYCTMLLADMGAEVIKIEQPGGDPTRGYKTNEHEEVSPSFLSMNRNKHSVALDMFNPEERKLALEIALKADVLVENFSTGVMEKFGLGYQELSERNPKLIYCSISGYGRNGPLSERSGYDPVVQAESGIMSLNGTEQSELYRCGIAFVDLAAGMFAAHAILAALYARSNNTSGQFIDVPLFDTGVSLTSYHGMNYLMTGDCPKRVGNGSAVIAPAGLYDAYDGKFFLTVAGDKVWEKLLGVLGRPALLTNKIYKSNHGRLKNKAELDIHLNNIFSNNKCETWIKLLRTAGIPSGKVQDIKQSLDSEEVRSNNMVLESHHASLGPVPCIPFPIRMSKTPLVYTKAAPLLGTDLDYVKTRLSNR